MAKAKQQTTRERLIDAAHRLAQCKGFDRTSVADVMTEAGVGKGTFFYHFPSKDSLGLAVLEKDRADFMQMIDDCLDAPTPREGLERFFAAAFRKHESTGFTGGCIWGNTALEMSDANPEYTALVAEVFAQWTAKIAANIQEGQDCGEVRADIPAENIARCVVAVIEGAIMMSRLTKQGGPLKTCLKTLRTGLAVNDQTSGGSRTKETGNEANQKKKEE